MWVNSPTPPPTHLLAHPVEGWEELVTFDAPCGPELDQDLGEVIKHDDTGEKEVG